MSKDSELYIPTLAKVLYRTSLHSKARGSRNELKVLTPEQVRNEISETLFLVKSPN